MHTECFSITKTKQASRNALKKFLVEQIQKHDNHIHIDALHLVSSESSIILLHSDWSKIGNAALFKTDRFSILVRSVIKALTNDFFHLWCRSSIFQAAFSIINDAY